MKNNVTHEPKEEVLLAPKGKIFVTIKEDNKVHVSKESDLFLGMLGYTVTYTLCQPNRTVTVKSSVNRALDSEEVCQQCLYSK
jgi:hypothetical protein